MSNKLLSDNLFKDKNMAKRKGACGGKRRRDGSGGGTGNAGTKRQPKRKK